VGLVYRRDPDLEFLGELESKDLDQLVRLLIYDPDDGEKRISEELSQCEEFQRYYPDHRRYWRKIAAELQKYGGNSFANLLRGGMGVPYREIVTDVAEKLGAKYRSFDSTEEIEDSLMMKVLEEGLRNMSPQEKLKLFQEMEIDPPSTFSGGTVVQIFQGVFRAGGFKSYQLTVIIANAVLKSLIGRGLSLAGNAMLTRGMAILTGPIGWAISGIWVAMDIAGPAYRVTTPAVFEIAYLRKKYLYQ
jgi:uncharacterized protein YaaW (UPF0174 family)